MRGRKFESDDQVKSIVSDWLRHQSKDFYPEGIRKLVQRWEKCVTLLEDYVEKKIKLLSVLDPFTENSPNSLNDPRSCKAKIRKWTTKP